MFINFKPKHLWCDTKDNLTRCSFRFLIEFTSPLPSPQLVRFELDLFWFQFFSIRFYELLNTSRISLTVCVCFLGVKLIYIYVLEFLWPKTNKKYINAHAESEISTKYSSRTFILHWPWMKLNLFWVNLSNGLRSRSPSLSNRRQKYTHIVRSKYAKQHSSSTLSSWTSSSSFSS